MVATPPDEHGGNNTPASTNDNATRVIAIALEEANKITGSGGTQIEALAAAEKAARRAYSLRSGSGRTLTRGDDGEDGDLVSSSSTSVTRDEVALDKGCMPISYIGGQSNIVSVVTDPGQQEIIVNMDSKIHNSHNGSICDNVFQCLVSFVDALDESIGDKSLQLRELYGCSSTVTSSVCSGETGLSEWGIDYNRELCKDDDSLHISGLHVRELCCLGGSGCGSTVRISACSDETGLLERGIDYKMELCCKEDSLHISGTSLLRALSRLSGINATNTAEEADDTTKTAEEADGSGVGKNTAVVVAPGGGRYRPHGTLVSATEKKSDDERRLIFAGAIDYDPNWRDSVADTVVTTPRAGNTHAGLCQMQQQQRINLPGEAYQPHPGASPHSRPVSGEPYSIVPKININLSRDIMDEFDERIDRYIPAYAGGVSRQGDRIYC
jgi:hypothetical protein